MQIKIKKNGKSLMCTIMFLSFWTDRSGQTVQTQTRLHLIRVYTVGLALGIIWTYHPIENHCSNAPLYFSVQIFQINMVQEKDACRIQQGT